MSCCNSCAEAERAAARVGGYAEGTYEGGPLDPVQLCWARVYSAREISSGYADRDKRACDTRARAEVAAGRGAPRMPRPGENIYNARETGPGNDPFRARRPAGRREPLPGPAPKPAAAAKPAPAAPRPAVPRPGGTPKGGPSPTQRGASPFRPATPTPNRATMLNARQVRSAMAAIPKATQFQMRQAAQAAQAAAYPPAPPGYEWADAPPQYAYPPPGYEYAPLGYEPEPPQGYEYAFAPPPEAASDGGDLGALLDELLASDDPADVDLAALVVAELTGGSSVAGIGAGPVTNPTVRAVDDVISSLWGGLRGIVPGGDAIDVVHQARRELMYGPEARTDRGRTSPGGPGGRLPAAASSPVLPARTSAEGRTATVGPTTSTAATIAELQRLVRAAARGGSSSAAARDLRALKTAARASPEARRRWVASVAVMRDDLARIRAASR